MTEARKREPGSGGRRPGSGRKAEDRVAITYSLARVTVERLRRESKERGVPIVRIIDELVAGLDKEGCE